MATIRTVISSREFDQDLDGVKRKAETGPVVVMDHGRPTFVLMTHEAYEALEEKKLTLLEIFNDPRPEADFEFEVDRPVYPESSFIDSETD